MTILDILSSIRVGEIALQIANKAYIRSSVLLIYDDHISQHQRGLTIAQYLIILVTPRVVLPHPEDEVEYRHEGSDSVWVSTEHDVAETDIVVGGDMASSDSGKG